MEERDHHVEILANLILFMFSVVLMMVKPSPRMRNTSDTSDTSASWTRDEGTL